MVAEPDATPVMVTIFPLTETVAMSVALEDAEIAPSPARVTVIAPLVVVASRDSVSALRLRLPAALPMVQETLLAVVVPSLQR